MREKIWKWLVHRHRWILGFTILGILAVELFEYNLPYSMAINLFEVTIYCMFLLVTESIINLLSKSTNQQEHALTLLRLRQKINQEFMTQKNWDELAASLVKIPAEVAPIVEAGLSIHHIRNNRYEMAAHWLDGRKQKSVLPEIDDCTECQLRKFGGKVVTGVCTPADPQMMASGNYCFPIYFDGFPIAVLNLRVKPGVILDKHQIATFESLCEAMAIAIKAAQDRQELVEMRLVETSLDERRRFYQYLHDALGPNLGYMRLKLDQLISEQGLIPRDIVLEDLNRLRDAAADSTTILRGILETNHSQTTPVLTNVLREYGRKVSERANFKLNFHIQGEPLPVSQEVSQTIFFVFQELLNNVEKHSAASSVDVEVRWGEDQIELSVSDDGKGFDVHAVRHNQHFGLEIMRERVARVKGNMNLVSTKNAGTIVTICLPGSHQEVSMVVEG